MDCEMTYERFNNIINNLKNCVLKYENANFFDNKVSLYLANGDTLKIRFPRNGVAHLLGVNIDCLKLSNSFPKWMVNSYDFFNHFLDDSFKFGKLILSSKKLEVKDVFSSYIDNKISSFWENIHIRIDDLVCVIKYDSEKIYQSTNLIDVSDYYIVRKKDNYYYVLGLAMNEEKGGAYVPTTSRIYDDEEEFEKFMRRVAYKQELTYVNNYIVSNDSQNFQQKVFINLDQKREKLISLIQLGKKYSSSVTVGSDFLFFLKKNKFQVEANRIQFSILSLLKESIQNGNVLDLSMYDSDFSVSDEIMELINLCNNLVCSTSESAMVDYSSVSDENKKLKAELVDLRNKLTAVNQEKVLMDDRLKTIEEQNAIYQEQLSIYDDAFQKVRKLGIKTCS